MNVKGGDSAVIIGGAEFRPEDIGRYCEVVGWFEAGALVNIAGYEPDYNRCGEAAWAVALVDDIEGPALAMKRDAWLMPLRGDFTPITEIVKITVRV